VEPHLFCEFGNNPFGISLNMAANVFCRSEAVEGRSCSRSSRKLSYMFLGAGDGDGESLEAI